MTAFGSSSSRGWERVWVLVSASAAAALAPRALVLPGEVLVSVFAEVALLRVGVCSGAGLELTGPCKVGPCAGRGSFLWIGGT